MKEALLAFDALLSFPIDDIGKIGLDISIPIITKEVILDICYSSLNCMKCLPRCVTLSGPIVIVGDLHGNLHDLIRIFKLCGSPECTKYLFLGDYVDRGQYSTETILYLLLLLVTYPTNITLLRGNHELPDINSAYGFKNEIVATYADDSLWKEFNKVFEYMPIAAVLDNKIFCVHGGIASGFTSLSQLNKIPKPLNQENMSTLALRLLWSDPSDVIHNFGENERGHGELFGDIAIKNFFESTGTRLIIRAHQCVQHGIKYLENKTCVTLFSSSGYASNNLGAVMRIDGDKAEILTYKHVEYPLRSNCLFYTIKPRSQEQKYSYTMISGFLRPSISAHHISNNLYVRAFKSQTLKFKPEKKIIQSSSVLKSHSIVSPRISI